MRKLHLVCFALAAILLAGGAHGYVYTGTTETILPPESACTMETRTMQEISMKPRESVFSGGLGGMADGAWKTWSCFREHPCLDLMRSPAWSNPLPGDAVCYKRNSVDGSWILWGLQSETGVGCSAAPTPSPTPSPGPSANSSGIVPNCTGCSGCGTYEWTGYGYRRDHEYGVAVNSTTVNSTTGFTTGSGSEWTISDGPGNYPDHAECDWIFTSSYVWHDSVKITFPWYSTESCCDSIQVFSCNTRDCSDRTMIRELRGSSSANSSTAVSGTYGYRTMMVRFKTDHSITQSGFEATFQAYYDMVGSRYSMVRRNGEEPSGPAPIEFSSLVGGASLQALIQDATSDAEVMIIDGEAGSTLSIQDALVVIPPGAFVGAATVTASFSEFSEGTSRRSGSSRSSMMKFKVDSPAVSSSSPVEITMNIPAGKAALPVGSGNKLYLSWLNKVTNEWTSVCGESSLDTVTGDFTTKMPTAVLNDPAFNPSSGCAIDLIGPCDGSGGELTVFELPKSSCA